MMRLIGTETGALEDFHRFIRQRLDRQLAMQKGFTP